MQMVSHHHVNGKRNNYIDLSKAKSEALVYNKCKQKELNRAMLNGDENENVFKTNRSN